MKRLLFSLLFLTFNSIASVDIHRFGTPEQEQRYQTLINELRCLVCQNQNLADSDAELAKDLRQKVYNMIIAEKSYQDVVDFMVARYGDFILYRPPFKRHTLLLWLGPFLFLIIGLMTLMISLHKNKPSIKKTSSNNKRKKLLKD